MCTRTELWAPESNRLTIALYVVKEITQILWPGRVEQLNVCRTSPEFVVYFTTEVHSNMEMYLYTLLPSQAGYARTFSFQNFETVYTEPKCKFGTEPKDTKL